MYPHKSIGVYMCAFVWDWGSIEKRFIRKKDDSRILSWQISWCASLGGQDQWVRRGARNFMGFHNNERIVWYRTGGSVKWRERWEKSSC